MGAVVATASIGAPAAGGSPAGPAQTEGFNRGTGSAIAESFRVDPVAGGLSFGIGVGQALAGHQNSGAIAESRAMNLGVIGTTLAAQGCDGGDPTLPADQQPGVLRVASNDEGAEAGTDDQDPLVPGIDRHGRATTAPFAEAITTGGDIDIPGVLSIQGVRASATSGVIDDELREAIARVEIGRFSIAGVIDLRGMVWEAVHRTGSADEHVGTFAIGSLTIAGTPVPVDDPTQSLAQANDLLQPLGFELRPPRVHYDDTARGTLATVDPLGIRVIPSPTRDGIVSPVLSGLQPVRDQLFNALIEMDCGNASYITILDIVLNAFGAGGYFALELGGVQATTAELRRFEGLGGSGGLLPSLEGNLPASGTLDSGTTRTPSAPLTPTNTGSPTGDATSQAPDTGTSDASIDDAVEAAATSGTRGGALAGVGAGGLLLLLATAEGDRRKMRRAMREIPMEA